MKSFKQDIQAKIDEQKNLTNEIYIIKNETLSKISSLQLVKKNLGVTQKEVSLSKEAKETEKTRQQEEKQSIKNKIDFLVEEVLFNTLLKILLLFFKDFCKQSFLIYIFPLYRARRSLESPIMSHYRSIS